MTPQDYLKKCLELSERATAIPISNLVHECGDDAADFSYDVDPLYSFSRTALPKVCEALRIALHALDELQDYTFYSQADRCEYLDRKFILINRLFDDADGG